MAFNPQFYAKNITGLPDLMGWANDLSGGILAPLTIFALWIILFIGSTAQFQSTNKGMAFSSIFCLIQTTIYIILTWVPSWFISFPLVLIGLTGLLLFINKE